MFNFRRTSSLKFDEIDIESIELYFETEDRWWSYQVLKSCIDVLLSSRVVYLDSEFSWLRRRFIKSSEILSKRLKIPDEALSDALELLDELKKYLNLGSIEKAGLQVIFDYLEGVLSGFVGIRQQAFWLQEQPKRLRVRFED